MNLEEQTLGAFAIANEKRKKSLLQYVSEGATSEDLDAAGYTSAEVAAAFPPEPSPNTSIPAEFGRDRQGGTEEYVAKYGAVTQATPPTIRDKIRSGIEGAGKAVGYPYSKDFARDMAGDAVTAGLLDFTPVGVPMGVQEGYRQAAAGYRTGDKTDMALGTLNAGLNVAAVIPGVKAGVKALDKLSGKLVENYNPNVLGSNLGNTRRVRTDLPIVEKYPALEKPSTENFQSVMEGLRTSNAEELTRIKGKGFGASERALTRIQPVLDNADENLVKDLIEAANSADPRDATNRLLYKYDETVIPDDVTISDLQALGNSLSHRFNYKAPSAPAKTTFRSATEEAIEGLEIGKKGLLGSRLLKQLKKNPDVRDTEWTALDLEVDPKKYYTKEELVDLVGSKAYDVSVNTQNKFSMYQRQKSVGLQDTEKDYFELTVDAKPRQGGTTFKPKDKHYSEENLAHTRASVRGPLAGVSDKDFILAEEFQSDLLQKGFEPKGAAVPANMVESAQNLDASFAEQLAVARTQKSYDSFWNDALEEMELVEVPSRKAALYAHWNNLSAKEKEDILSAATKATDPETRYNETSNAINRSFHHLASDRYDIDDLTSIALRSVKPSTQATRVPPIAKTSESVGLAIDALLAEGQKRGVTTLVIPPFEKIVEARYTKGTEEYRNALSKKSGFYQTYIEGVDKKIKELEGLGAKVEKVDMPYNTAWKGDVLKTLLALDDTAYDKVLRTVHGDDYAISGLTLDDFRQQEAYELRINSDLEESYRDALVSNNFVAGKPEGPLKGIKIDFEELSQTRDLSRPRMAEGGLVEDEQMNRLMAEGGMTDDGMNIEPVTGNEIPPGSLAKEVRDDIDAKLSEGEYVVPADVVRFFGVRFFEDLRMQAKQGLSEMDADGRIGGTSVNSEGIPMEEDEELSPEEEQMLKMALGSTDEAAGMAVGGDVEPFDRTKFTLSDSSSNTGRESRKYVDPTTGVTQTFQFLFGQPVTPIPSNFVPWTQELQDNATKTGQTITAPPTAPEMSRDTSGGGSGPSADTSGGAPGGGGSGGGGFNYDNWAKENQEALDSNPYQFGLDALTDKTGQLTGKVIGGVGLMSGALPVAAVGAGVSAYNKVQNIAEASAALKVMEAKGLTDTENYKSLQKVIGIAVDALPAAQKFLVEKEIMGSGNKYFKSYEDLGAKPKPATTPAKPGTAAPAKRATTAAVTPSSNRDRQDGGWSNTPAAPAKPTTAKPLSTGTGVKGLLSAGKTATPAKPASAPKKETVEQKQKRGGGYKDGGLVSKPARKNKNY